MNSTHILTQQILESFHTRLRSLEYLTGLKRAREKDDWEMLNEVFKEYQTRYPSPSNRPYTMKDVEQNSVDNDLIVQVLSQGKTLHVKVCKDDTKFQYTIWIFGDDNFKSSAPSRTNAKFRKRGKVVITWVE